MSNFDNTNSGALFKNKAKTKDAQPDYKGDINIDGVEYWLSAWIKTSKAGETYMSLSPQPKKAAASKAPAISGDAFDDDSGIPF